MHVLSGAVVFGSDQGLVGQFNDIITDYAVKELEALPGKVQVWAVGGERVYSRLVDEACLRLDFIMCQVRLRPLPPHL